MGLGVLPGLQSRLPALRPSRKQALKVPKTQRVDHVPNRVPLQPGECRDAVHWFVDSVGLYQGSVRGLFLSDYSEDQEALLESAVINFKSRGVTTMVITGEMLYKQADYLFPHAVAQSPFGRPLLSKMELDMLDADVLIVKDLNAPETPQQLWYLYHHLLYPRALSQRTMLISTQLGYEEFLGYGAMCEDLEYAGRKVTWEKAAWLLDSIMIDLHHFRQVRSENLPPMLKVEYYLYKAVASRGLTLTPQWVLGDYSVDFSLMERKGNKLAIECDVLSSLDQPNAASADAKRTLVLLSDGWKLLRFSSGELLANLGGCVEAVEEAWVHGYKRAPYGRLISGQQSAVVLDLPVEDDMQRLAITNGAGPVAITGGAGTGKSTCITRRVVHLLTQGVNPERILVVSHSTESVRSLRNDVEKLLDKQQAQKVAFYSWNELGLKLLKENTAAIKRKPPLKVEANPQRIIQRLLVKYKKDLDQLTLELSEELEEFTIASLISLYKANLVTPKHVKERAKGNVDELVARVYQGYEEQLQKSNKIDRDDMVCLAAQLLADNADIRARYQYQYEYVVIDEFQDATAAADLLARVLSLPQDNLYIAGDEDESIFESKGALPRILSEVSIRLPNARCYVLEHNWRCHPTIVNHAKRLLDGLHRRRINKDMVPGWDAVESQAIVGPYLAESEAQEAEWVASEIQLLLDTGRNPQDVAILYRYNRYASMIEEALFRKGIKCLTTNPDSTMVPDEVADVMAFLRLVMDPDGPKARESFERVCQLRSKEVDPKLFGTIASFAEANNLSFLKAVEIYSEAVADQSCMDLSQLVRIIRTMNHENLPPSETIALLKRTQRLTEYYKSVKVPPGVNYEPMRKLGALEEEARKFKTVTEFVRSQQNLLKANDGPDSEPLVYILSLHEAKGKEYPVVFLTGMAEGLFPSETANDPEEERRLCYLGMTRAREVLYLSYPHQFNNITLEPSRYLFDTGLVGPNMPTRHVDAASAMTPSAAVPGLNQAAASTPAQAPVQPAAAAAAPAQQPPPAVPAKPLLTPQEQAAQQQVLQAAALKSQQEETRKAEQDSRLAEARAKEALLKAQEEQQLRAQHEAAMRAQAEHQARLKAQQEASAKQQEEQLKRFEQETLIKAQQEQKIQADKAQTQQAALKAQHEQLMQAKREADYRAQQEQQMMAQQQNSLRGQQDERMRLQQEAQMRAQDQAQRQAQQEIELRSQHEQQVRARLESTQRAQQDEKLRAQDIEVKAQQAAAFIAQQEMKKQIIMEAAQFAEMAQQEEAVEATAGAVAHGQSELDPLFSTGEAPPEQHLEQQTMQTPVFDAAPPAVSPEAAFEQAAYEDPGASSPTISPYEAAQHSAAPEPVAEGPTKKGKGKKKTAKTLIDEPTPMDVAAAAAAPPSAVPESPYQQQPPTMPPSAQPAYGAEFFDPAAAPTTEQPLYQPQPQDQAAAEPESPYQAPSVPIPSPTFKPVKPPLPASAQYDQNQHMDAQPEQPVMPQPLPQPMPSQATVQQPLTADQQAALLLDPMQSMQAPQEMQAMQDQQAPARSSYDDLSDLDLGEPEYEPQSYGRKKSRGTGADAVPPTVISPVQASASEAQTADARQTFWNTVNSAMRSDMREVPGGGVPQGVSAPIPAYFPEPGQHVQNAPATQGPSGQPAPHQVQGGSSCPGCSEYLEPGSRFCGECGYRLEIRITACHLCGAPQEPGAKFCGECGSKAADVAAESAVAVGMSAQEAEQARQYEAYLSGQKPTQQAWVTKLKKILD